MRNCGNSFIHLATCPCGSLNLNNQARLEWSVRTVNTLPNSQYFNCQVNLTIAKRSLRVEQYLFCSGVREKLL
ncbi:hypothetical protein DPMN_171348 [Dreissena polymorpha]|uniref:Uncharacterized protein n=1 Tax=Dreissena polymorpha TaxID=45954 RepID=A0A9D4DZJ9_DREPO|nr:hypothetical protein DPMN_171348 [Dreissena polymorpha]